MEEASSDAMELKLQQNLLKQHENYARQKELLQKLKMQSEATARNLSMPSMPKTTSSSPVSRDRSIYAAAVSPRPLSSSIMELAKDDQRIQDIYSQELVNDGLRKQLELIRRLESDNSRLRSESGALRTQVTLLEDRSKLKERELARQAGDLEDAGGQLRDLRQDHQYALQQGQQTQQALAKVTRVKDALEEELRAALDTQRRLHERIHLVDMEVDQAKAREAALVAHTKALEVTQAKHEATIHDLQLDIQHLQETLSQKSDQVTAVQSSATSCVEHLEASLKAVQDNLSREQEKRRTWETACHGLETELENFKTNEVATKQALDSVRDLRDRNAALEEKQPYFHQLELDNKDMHAKLLLAQRDREEHERLVVQMKHGIWQTTTVLKKEFEAIRAYVVSMEEEEGGILLEDVDVQVTSWHECPTEIQILRSVLHHFKHDLVHLSQRMVEGREKEAALQNEGNQLQTKLVALRHDMKELTRQLDQQKEAYAIAESAREMSMREKRDLLLWSRATCQKTERMASEVDQWEQFTIQQVHRMHRLPWQETVVPIAELKYTSYAELRSSWEQALQFVLHEAHQCHVKCNQETHRANKETKRKLDLQRRLDSGEADWQIKYTEKDKEMQAMQLRHTTSLQTLQDQHRCLLKENDSQIATLTHQVEDLTVKWNACERDRQMVRDQHAVLEAQAPLYAGIAHMFVVCVRPMVLQISELQTQKRILSHQLGQLTVQQKEMEQIAALFQSTELKKPLKVTFRAAALAVFAANRLRHASGRQYGRNEALGLVFPQQIGVVKLLSMSSVEYSTEALLRLQSNAFVEKWTRLAQCPSASSSVAAAPGATKRHSGMYGHSGLGELVLSTLAAIDPSGECVLTNTLQGHASFLCDLHPVRSNDKQLTVDVHRIRRKVLEWMKKVENLQFQRTALQKDNYALQSQIHEKDFELREMALLNANAQELQEKLTMYQTHDGHGITLREFETCAAACQEAEARCAEYAVEIADKKRLVKELQSQLDTTSGRNRQVEEQLDVTRQALLDEEEAVVSLKGVVARYEVEMRKLTHAAHSVQSQFHQRCNEIESDKLELTALSALLQETQRKNQTLEDELDHMHQEIKAKASHHKDSALSRPGGSVHSLHRPTDGYGCPRPLHASALSSTHGEGGGGAAIEYKDLPHSLKASHARSSYRDKMHVADLESNEEAVNMDIDKVNLAVHSYMDRIDKKLQTMYGIPGSDKWKDFKFGDSNS
ncbi:hypothetical protein H257_17957 [Aphanomyces astaci]|uniref:Uncharacterized protein n=1 Tax=Aphanomyces astaci TaxID=112090 RepID=W4FCN9_APHAT|nr:hypothetical protein H257_17957 [Aphanomyces astaci]ETV65235.1 hypothetical protein H257_17957 [Aphanomyces astaci]|eukprot:XP_009845236.1 hypothetical protein H257_17957 [Aphanomyces astaci]